MVYHVPMLNNPTNEILSTGDSDLTHVKVRMIASEITKL